MLIEVFSIVWKLEKIHVSSSGKILLMALANIAHDGGKIFPSYDYLAKRCCMDRATVIRTMNKLCAKEWIVKTIRIKEGKKSHTSNIYEFNMEKLLNIQLEDAKAELQKLKESIESKKNLDNDDDGNVNDTKDSQGVVANCHQGVVANCHPNIKPLNTKLNNISLEGKKNTKKKDAKKFEEFWAEYPRKVSKHQAMLVWIGKKLDNDFDKIMQDLRARKKTEWLDREKKFIPHPDKYLRHEFWLDDIQDFSKSDKKSSKKNEFEGSL